jgi:amidase
VSTGAPPGANAEFVLTRSLRDAAAVLDVVADPDSPGRHEGGWAVGWSRPPERLRIGLLRGVDGVATDRELGDRAAEAAAELEASGHEILDLPSSFLADDDWERMQLDVRSRGARDRLRNLEALAGRPLTEDDAEPLMLALAARAAEVTDAEAEAAAAWQLRYAGAVAERWRASSLDALVSPTAGVPPQPLDVLVPPTDDPPAIYGWFRRIGAFTGPWNMTGQPAISIPWWTPPGDRLPAGVQLVGPVGGEDRILRLAHQLAERRPDRTAVRRP